MPSFFPNARNFTFQSASFSNAQRDIVIDNANPSTTHNHYTTNHYVTTITTIAVWRLDERKIKLQNLLQAPRSILRRFVRRIFRNGLLKRAKNRAAMGMEDLLALTVITIESAGRLTLNIIKHFLSPLSHVLQFLSNTLIAFLELSFSQSLLVSSFSTVSAHMYSPQSVNTKLRQEF
ncbi:hypothetical protein E1B28_012885 [Marasmius oreades]|uniref:Uncharacterized protein n=1 Tax=Marasmius oreades TaxID=181124 RepID=A0A9P7UPF0_9AGAR|nr:uncharacterized protein E1B28_012885 [Marasmius oreades]KAG7088940.1 hypothetical protein E1B28_012885 [Marasmius oreades]